MIASACCRSAVATLSWISSSLAFSVASVTARSAQRRPSVVDRAGERAAPALRRAASSRAAAAARASCRVSADRAARSTARRAAHAGGRQQQRHPPAPRGQHAARPCTGSPPTAGARQAMPPARPTPIDRPCRMLHAVTRLRRSCPASLPTDDAVACSRRTPSRTLRRRAGRPTPLIVQIDRRHKLRGHLVARLDLQRLAVVLHRLVGPAESSRARSRSCRG